MAIALLREARWISAFAIVALLWASVLYFALSVWVKGVEILVDKDADLVLLTFPLLIVSVLYMGSSFFISIVFLVSYSRLKKYQAEKKSVTKARVAACSAVNQKSYKSMTLTCVVLVSAIYSASAVWSLEEPVSYADFKLFSFESPIFILIIQYVCFISVVFLISFRSKNTILSDNKTGIDERQRSPVSSLALSGEMIHQLVGGNVSIVIPARDERNVIARTKYQAEKKSVTKARVTAFSRVNPDYQLLGGKVSIVIPARDERNVIARTINKLLQQTYTNIEIIVVCHNCTDDTFIQAKNDDDRVRSFELNTAAAGKGIALNHGVEKSSGEYILILDSDGLLADDFIENALPLFTDGYAAVQGRYISSNRNYNLVTRMLSLESDLWSAPFMTVRTVFGKRCPLAGTGFIISKNALGAAGGFNNSLVEDYELTFRLLRRGYRICFAPLSICYDEKPPELGLMMRQRSRWSRGFLNLATTRIATGNDILGNLYWFNPFSILASFALLLVSGYSGFHNLIFGYYPFTFAYIPLELWFGLIGLSMTLNLLTLVAQFGARGLKYSLLLPIQLLFSTYWFVASIKAFFVKSWASAKTTHGFVRESDYQQMIGDSQLKI